MIPGIEKPIEAMLELQRTHRLERTPSYVHLSAPAHPPADRYLPTAILHQTGHG